ncbi:MAG: hypothetical protein ACXADH_00085 [Candidatus Kariarchaeaceae archaeon]|jgi:hypothetical protein
MAVNISTQARNDAGDAIVDLIDVGSTNPNGYLEIRTGGIPANPQTAATGTLLATCSFSLPAFGNFSNGTTSSNPISEDTSVDATGVAGYFRFYDRDGNAVLDGEITATGGGGDLEFDNINFIVGGVVTISNITVTMPQ